MIASAQSPAVVPWHFFAGHRSLPFPFFVDRGLHGRPSFAGNRPVGQLVVGPGGEVDRWQAGQWQRLEGDPVTLLADFVEESRCPATGIGDGAAAFLADETLPRTVGYLAYELGRWADGPAAGRSAHGGAGRVGTPLAVLSTYAEIDAWDPVEQRSVRVRFADRNQRGNAAAPAPPPPLPSPDAKAWRATSARTYRRGFDRIREAIAAGEIYQANLSRRAVFDLAEDAADAYARLREIQPVPWGAFADFGGFALLSNSPECFLSRRGEQLCTRPIKGTRPRHDDASEDERRRRELAGDPKEMAEHLMIVDLERNDLGRVARIGSVRVGRFAEVESFTTLHHMVSEVSAEIRDDVDLAALLRATFPGGSITGAPKIRAVEILTEVEEADRGVYTGAIGFFNGGREIELSIAIRTALAAGGRLLCSTGGGLVADSEPEREWEETELKLEALRRALAPAARGAGDHRTCLAGVSR